MNIFFFSCNTEKERIQKEDYLINKVQLTGTLRDQNEKVNPTILIESPQFQGLNYLYIPDFQRYYFITSIRNIRTNLWEIKAHCDVIYTYRWFILQTKAIISKTQEQSNANLFYDDGSFILDSRKYNQVITFEQGLSPTGTLILIAAGGEPNTSS